MTYVADVVMYPERGAASFLCFLRLLRGRSSSEELELVLLDADFSCGAGCGTPPPIMAAGIMGGIMFGAIMNMGMYWPDRAGADEEAALIEDLRERRPPISNGVGEHGRE
eukprot:CAMPEP_0195010452 /NCGR_PEP_ID=MMETSP0326_2-20130528/10117_1 /TAXON_ID=2866 ORGANISM="Crypthecodinium cohnii, Strain Seligo" /NCGR_SAMPLE_ID=MMETSP0326_2 /ASSEMBLY_ACC=CAM_ASM_000348 /LENGTH=109 /DNA_ID=CAMNT_0040019105 /DNA_START=362 /DNA_END=689 /DNA_ORIENTATION=+